MPTPCLINDDHINRTATEYAEWQPAITVPDDRTPVPPTPCTVRPADTLDAAADYAADNSADGTIEDQHAEGRHATDPADVLHRILRDAPPEGITVPHMMAETRMSRLWVYLRIGELAETQRVVQVTRGHYCGTDPAHTDPGGIDPDPDPDPPT